MSNDITGNYAYSLEIKGQRNLVTHDNILDSYVGYLLRIVDTSKESIFFQTFPFEDYKK